MLARTAVPRNPRDDFPGAWWHLTNRGISKRAVYETREDVDRKREAGVR